EPRGNGSRPRASSAARAGRAASALTSRGAPGRRRARASAGTYQWATHRAACRARRRTAPAAPRSTTRGVAGLRPVGAGRASRTCHPASYATSARTARGPARCGTRRSLLPRPCARPAVRRHRRASGARLPRPRRARRASVKVEVEAREVGGPHGRELRTVVRSRTDALDEAARAVLDGPRSVLELVRCIAQLGQGLQQILGGVVGFGGRHPDLCNGACYTFAIPGVLRHSHPQSFDSGATRRMDLRKANAERGSRNAEPSSPPSVPRSAFRVPTLRPRASSAITFTVPSSL